MTPEENTRYATALQQMARDKGYELSPMTAARVVTLVNWLTSDAGLTRYQAEEQVMGLVLTAYSDGKNATYDELRDDRR